MPKLIIEVPVEETTFTRAQLADAASAALTNTLEEGPARQTVETGGSTTELIADVLSEFGIPVGEEEFAFRVED